MTTSAGNKTPPFDYQDRAVAFVDVLGFAAFVKRSDGNPVARAKIHELVGVNELFERFVGKYLGFAEATFFSDTFVLSMHEDRLFYLVREIGYLCRYLLLKGFLCRGAITVGSLFHHGRFVIGPALVEAYRLEQCVAVYPRVILDSAAMAYWDHEFRVDELGGKAAHSELEVLVQRDKDGHPFLDILSPAWSASFLPWTEFISSFAPIPSDPVVFLKKTWKHLEDGRLENVGNAKILAKYEWFAAECERRAAALGVRLGS